MELMKVIATNQMKLAKKVDLMNKRFKQFLSEATTTNPLDFNSLSVKDEPLEDFSAFSIDNPSKAETINSQSGVRTIQSKNSNPFDPVGSRTIPEDEPPLNSKLQAAGIRKTNSLNNMFPEIVGVDEQVKQLEAEMSRNSVPKKVSSVPPPKPPTMEELIQKNLKLKQGIVENPVSKETKKVTRKRKINKKQTETVSKETEKES